MSNVVQLLLTYVRPYWFRILIVFLVIVFSVAGYYTYKRIYTQINDEKKFGDVANNISSGQEITITFYHVDWCPHCTKAMGEWKMFHDQYDNQMVNGYRVVCIDKDCTDDQDQKITELLNRKKIASFPTVLAQMPGMDGKEMTIRFESKTTKENLEKFVLSISSKN